VRGFKGSGLFLVPIFRCLEPEVHFDALAGGYIHVSGLDIDEIIM
jgi:hypothetical protein